MKAILHTKYGPTDVHQLSEADKPVPGDGEIPNKSTCLSVNFIKFINIVLYIIN